MLSCARFLCNRARELLERAALEALDVGGLVEIQIALNVTSELSYYVLYEWGSTVLLYISYSRIIQSYYLLLIKLYTPYNNYIVLI